MNSLLKISLFDDYLDRLTGQLRFAPRDLKAQYRDEVRQHLESLVQARMEEDQTLSPAVAAAKAMEAFGDPRVVGRGIASEIGWGTGVMPGSLGMAVLSGIVWLTLLKLVVDFLTERLIPMQKILVMLGTSTGTSHLLLGLLIIVIQLTPVILVPWLAGYLTGLLAPKSASKGMLIAASATMGLYVYQSFGWLIGGQLFDLFLVSWGLRAVLWITSGYLAAFFSSMRLRGLKFNVLEFLHVSSPKGHLQ